MAGTATHSSWSETPSEYWCYSCNKRVCVEIRASVDDVVCGECKNGFVESILWSPQSTASFSGPESFALDESSTSTLGSQFLQMLRVFAHSTRESDAPSSPGRVSPRSAPDARSEEFLRIELDGWENDVDYEVEETGVEEEEDELNEHHSTRRDLLLNRITDLSARSRGGRNRILDWAEILMVLEDGSSDPWIDPDRYLGRREDYLDSVGFETLLQNLAESDGAAKRGAPPASRSAVEKLRAAEVRNTEEGVICAICKDGVGLGEEKTEMPCGHGYHLDCISTWLGTRNSCPVCRYELPTDDAEYEEGRMKRGEIGAGTSSSTSSSF